MSFVLVSGQQSAVIADTARRDISRLTTDN
jgi:hypothetical protein